MRFRGAVLISAEEAEPGIFTVLGRAAPLTHGEVKELSMIHGAAARRANVVLDDAEFTEFLGLRDHLRQLADYYGEPSFLLQPWILQKVMSAQSVSIEQALAGFKSPKTAVFETAFGIGTDAEFVRKPPQDRQSILIYVPFGDADVLVAAMFSDSYLFSSAALFSLSPPDFDELAALLRKASTIGVFQSNLMAFFPTIYAYDVSEDEFRITSKDLDFVNQVRASLAQRSM